MTDLALEERSWDIVEDITKRVKEIGDKDFNMIPLTSPMDTVYMFEAAVPFFTYFFQRYYTPTPEVDAKIPDHQKKTQRVFDTLLDFYEKMKKNPSYGGPKLRSRLNYTLQNFLTRQMTTEAQFDRYQEVALIPVEKSKVTKKGQDGAGSTKPAMKKYLEEYSDQLEKNELKNEFLNKIIKSYQNDPATPSYSDELHLPKGAEFQKHLAV